MRGRPWEYVFFVDLLRGDDEDSRNALRHLERGRGTGEGARSLSGSVKSMRRPHLKSIARLPPLFITICCEVIHSALANIARRVNSDRCQGYQGGPASSCTLQKHKKGLEFNRLTEQSCIFFAVWFIKVECKSLKGSHERYFYKRNNLRRYHRALAADSSGARHGFVSSCRAPPDGGEGELCPTD